MFSFSWEEFLSPFVQLIDTGNTSSIQGSTACSGEIPAAYSGCQMGTWHLCWLKIHTRPWRGGGGGDDLRGCHTVWYGYAVWYKVNALLSICLLNFTYLCCKGVHTVLRITQKGRLSVAQRTQSKDRQKQGKRVECKIYLSVTGTCLLTIAF